MKLSRDSVQNLRALLQAASLVKIDNLIIEKDAIRGIDDEKSVVVLSEDNIPDFNGLCLGLNRLENLSKRLLLAASTDENFDVIVEESDRRAGEISHLLLKTPKTKTQFRAANPSNIKAPKALKDIKSWLVMVPQDDVAEISKSAAVMGSEEIILTRKPSGEMFFEFIDPVTQDSLSYKFGDNASWIPEDTDPSSKTFVHYYRVKSFMPLLKAAGEGDVPLVIGKQGMMWIDVMGFAFTIIPRIGDR